MTSLPDLHAKMMEARLRTDDFLGIAGHQHLAAERSLSDDYIAALVAAAKGLAAEWRTECQHTAMMLNEEGECDAEVCEACAWMKAADELDAIFTEKKEG